MEALALRGLASAAPRLVLSNGLEVEVELGFDRGVGS